MDHKYYWRQRTNPVSKSACHTSLITWVWAPRTHPAGRVCICNPSTPVRSGWLRQENYPEAHRSPTLAYTVAKIITDFASKPRWKARTNSWEVPPDLHTCTMACSHLTHSLELLAGALSFFIQQISYLSKGEGNCAVCKITTRFIKIVIHGSIIWNLFSFNLENVSLGKTCHSFLQTHTPHTHIHMTISTGHEIQNLNFKCLSGE